MQKDNNPFRQFLRIATALLVLTITFDSTAFSQENPNKTFTNGSIGFTGGINSYSNIKAHPGFNHLYTYSKTGFRWGIELTYRFSKRSALSTGLYYFNFAYKVDYAWIFQQPNDPAIPRTTDVRVNYVDVPLIYDFSIVSQNKLVVYTATGLVFSHLNSQTGSTTYEDNSVRKFDYLNSFITSLQLGVGLQYNINKYVGIKIEPHYRLFLKGFDSIMEQSPTAINGTVCIVGNLDWKCFFKKGAWRPLPTCD